MLHAGQGHVSSQAGTPGVRYSCGGNSYGDDWFSALQCCYLQVNLPRNSGQTHNPTLETARAPQHGYLAEPLSQEEQDKIGTYLTICRAQLAIRILNPIYELYYPPILQSYTNLPLHSQWGEQAEHLVDRSHRPSPGGASQSRAYSITASTETLPAPGHLDLDVWRALVLRVMGRGRAQPERE